MKSFSLSRWFCLLVAWSLPALADAQEGRGWQARNVDGRDYLPLDQISRFYGLEEPRVVEKEVILENKRVRLVFEAGSFTCFMNGIKFVFRHQVEEVDGVAHVSREDLSLMLDPVLRPNHIKNAGEVRTVILDPAHGGKDRGAASSLGSAADYSLAVAKLAAKKLREQGYGVVLTREDDVDRTLKQRLDTANAVEGNAIFVCIDFSSGPKGERGVETRTLAHADREAVELGAVDFGSSSIALATGVHSTAMRVLGGRSADLGVRRSGYAEFSKIRHPAIEIRGGFLTHEDESKIIHTEAYQSALVDGIVLGIQRYRAAVR